MDFIGIGFLLTFVLLAIAVVVGMLFMLRAMYRSSKSAASGAGNLLTTIEGAAGTLAGRFTSGATHGAIFDQVEGLLKQLVSGGYLDATAAEAFLVQVATAMAKHKAVPVTEVTAT